MDIETINLDNLGTQTLTPQSIKLNKDSGSKSSTLGIELLMNEKKKKDSSEPGSPKSDINLGDLNSLEAELNNLSGVSNKGISMKEARSSLFGGKEESSKFELNDKISLNSEGSGSIGSVGSNGSVESLSKKEKEKNVPIFKLNKEDGKPKNEKTWDGMAKFNDIPLDPAKQIPTQPKLSPEETLNISCIWSNRSTASKSKGVLKKTIFSLSANSDNSAN